METTIKFDHVIPPSYFLLTIEKKREHIWCDELIEITI
jgi:hypothetical protein